MVGAIRAAGCSEPVHTADLTSRSREWLFVFPSPERTTTMDVFSIAAGAAGVGVAYFLYLVGTKGLPAALAWVKARWNAGKANLAQIEADLEGVTGKVTSLEQLVLPALQAAQADISALKELLPKAAASTVAAGQAAVAASLAPAASAAAAG
jgi:hypothetical protein